MANQHILTIDGAQLRIVRHLAIPAGNNAAGVSWRDAVVRSGMGGTTILPDGDGVGGTISAAEKAQIEAGAVYESVGVARPPPGLSGAAIGTWLDEDYAANAAALQATLQARLQQYGRVR